MAAIRGERRGAVVPARTYNRLLLLLNYFTIYLLNPRAQRSGHAKRETTRQARATARRALSLSHTQTHTLSLSHTHPTPTAVGVRRGRLPDRLGRLLAVLELRLPRRHLQRGQTPTP